MKELLLVDPERQLRVGDLPLRMLPRLSADTPMYDLLRLFESGRSHMAVLTEPPPITINSLQAAALTSGTDGRPPLSVKGRLKSIKVRCSARSVVP